MNMIIHMHGILTAVEAQAFHQGAGSSILAAVQAIRFHVIKVYQGMVLRCSLVWCHVAWDVQSQCGASNSTGASTCRYSYENAPIQKELQAREVGNAAAFLLSPLASAVTGSTLYVDNGLNAMGLAVDSQTLARKEEPVSA